MEKSCLRVGFAGFLRKCFFIFFVGFVYIGSGVWGRFSSD